MVHRDYVTWRSPTSVLLRMQSGRVRSEAMDGTNPTSTIAPRRMLLTKAEVKKLLGIGERAFGQLGIAYVRLGRRRRYLMEDVLQAVNKHKNEGVCRYAKERGHHTGGTISRSEALGFEEALKRPI